MQTNVPVPMILHCISCGMRHVDEGVWATKPHHTHECQSCGVCWRPAIVHTVGVKKLPWDVKNDDIEQKNTEHQLLLIADDLAKGIAIDDNDQGYELTFFSATNKNVFKYILKTLNTSDVTKFRNRFINKMSPMFTSCDSEKCLVDKDVMYHGYRR